ncbi:hypothetical protein LX16_4772 [Stackebrandtia albiflava]|uniref:Methylamine utilisation protein MauE domain-containing protein n=1 Tax=Stackebrandtia albiflava TaxID=406432 RepID=A0A562UQU9_9ACTN|nr:MauE/DoxX family redox-associated membrane protein [Stackebrandtia albiflava]TWJ07989.1 hypothetical protein LX16_4772 [Stackebrandtia albiflava]
MPYLLLAVQFGLAGVFLVSSVAKVKALADTVRMWTDLLQAVRLPAGLAGVASWALIAGEFATGLALLVPVWLFPWGLWPATALLVGFTVLAVVSARTTMNLKCACFGRATTPLGWRHFWRNLVLLGMAVTGLVVWGGGATPATDPAGVAVAALAAALVALLAAFYDDIMDLVLE